ncbi:hypothetical protein ACE6H2_007533 [Prunus campanulata]
MMINPPDHSCNVTYFINNQPQQFINYSVVLQIMPAAASNWTRSYSNNSNNHHEIFAFVIPTLLTLVQMRYPAVDLFQTHPTAITILLSSLLAYCFAFSLGNHSLEYWCRMAMLVFGSLSVASLLWLLFLPHSSSYLILCVLLLLLVVVLSLKRLVNRKLWQRISQELRAAQNCISQRACPILPVTSMNVSHSHRPTIFSNVIVSHIE